MSFFRSSCLFMYGIFLIYSGQSVEASVSCTVDEFQCSDKQCIDKLWQCNGDPDCNDQSDEINCTTNDTMLCSVDTEWECHTGEQCINKFWKCDGDEDCLDASDELHCNTTCRPDQFKCDNRECIYISLKCDGYIDCMDGSDEASCSTPTALCPSDKFDCYKNATLCIEASKLCDSRKDCENLADEDSELCERNRCNVNNGDCMQTCIPVDGNKRRCECLDGFRLVGNTSCEDINECVQWPPVCSQKCSNEMKGSYKCECIPGYYPEILEDGQHVCKAIGERPWLLFANRHDIRKLEVDTMTLQPIISDLRSAVAVDYDYYNKLVYWSDTDTEKIMKASMTGETNGTGVPVIGSGVKTPDGMAVDWIHHNLYWTDTGYNTIEVASADGLMRKILVEKDLDEPRSIALDPRNGWMYFSDWGKDPKIERIGMDGNPDSRTAIVKDDIVWPNGLCLDYGSERIYWIDARLKSIFTADLDGMNVHRILHNSEQILHPFSLAVFEDNVYWTDWSARAIRKVHKYTGEQYSQLPFSFREPMGIKVYHPQKQLHSPNKCGIANGGCSHLCLPTPAQFNANEYACVCPANITLLNGKQCETSDGSRNTTITKNERVVQFETIEEDTILTFPLHCSSNCNPPCKLNWFKDGKLLSDETNEVLNMPRNRTMSGVYICRATGKEGTGTSKQVTVWVTYGPENVTITSPQAPIENTPFSLRCSADCLHGCESYRWSDESGRLIKNTAILTFDNLNRTDNGNYTCSVEDYFGRISTKYNLKVQYGTTNVTIQYSSDYGHLKEGQDYIRISCNADCNPECSYQYYKDNKFVNDPDRRLLVDRKMSGRYICSAKNSFMNAYKDSTNFVDINIKYGPAITFTILENRKHISAHAPGTLNLTFNIDSFPTSNVTMFHNKVNLKTISNVTGQHIFTKPIKSCLDEGEYQVDAANEVGSDSTSVIVNVTCSPILISFLNTSDKEFRIGDRVDLTVAFKGNPAAEVSWTFKPWNSNTSLDVPVHRIQNQSKYRTALVIETLNTNDFGTYKLQLKNIHGSISQDFKIQGPTPVSTETKKTSSTISSQVGLSQDRDLSPTSRRGRLTTIREMELKNLVLEHTKLGEEIQKLREERKVLELKQQYYNIRLKQIVRGSKK
uniref:Uncharacterized protein LOC111127521 n=1 Tax=Crassostrea virginica TaxID=6565 RepID=A0A8B8DJW5_CRAVI|nr:uncharacterized protein LOC111127521 [Crassostrea virginica]